MTVLAGGIVAALAATGVVATPAAFVVVAVGLAVWSIGYAAMSRHVHNAGAFAAFITSGLGRIPGVGASVLSLVSYNAIQISLYGLFGVVASGFATEHLGSTWPWWVWAGGAMAAVGVLGMRRVKLSGRVLAVLLAVEVGAVLLFDAGAFLHPAGGHVSFAGLDPAGLAVPGVGGALAFVVASFVGFEGGPDYAEETVDAGRSVPRSIYLTVAVTGGLYAVSAWALTVAVGPDRVVDAARNPSSGLPFSVIGADFGPAGGVLSVVANLTLLTSVFGALLAFHNVVARYVFASARDHVLPVGLARIGRQSGAPVAGSLAQTGVAFVVVAGFALLGGDPFAQLFTWLSYVAALGVLVLMVGTSVAVVGFFARNAHLQEGVLRTVAAPMVSGLGLVVIAWLTFANSGAMLGGDGSGLRWVFVGLLVLAFGLGLARGTYLHANRPETFQGIGAAVPVPGGIPRQRDGVSDAFAGSGGRRPGVWS
jgi:amino acid transporter